MDVTRFTANKTGDLVPVMTDEGPDHAFVPYPLPREWKLPYDLWPMLTEAHKELTRLDERGKTFGNPSLLLEPLQKREALRSSSIEGTYATAKELLLFEVAPKASKDEAQANDHREISNYDEALRYGAGKSGPAEGPSALSIDLIREMHAILLRGVRGSRNAGLFRTSQVYVRSDRRYVPPPAEAIQACMDDFQQVLQQPPSIDPLVLSYMLHYQFEAIHPFRDGNGRVGRLLLALTTYRWTKLELPWLYMSAYFERFKDEYTENMLRISTHGDWEEWIRFCLRGTAIQARDAIRRCDALNGKRAQMHKDLDKLPRMAHLIDRMFVSPIFNAEQLSIWSHSSTPTARRDIEQMIKAGWVEYLYGERPKWYFVPAIFKAAYAEDSQSEVAL